MNERYIVRINRGRIKLPKEILEQYKNHEFVLEVVDGKIILDPIKIDE